MHPLDHEYLGRMQKFKLPSLASIRKVKDSIMASKLIVGEIDYEDLCDKFVDGDLPYELCQIRPFLESSVSSRFRMARFSLIPRLIDTWNGLPTSITNETYFPKFKWLVKSTFLKYE